MESKDKSFSKYREELRKIAGTGWDNLNEGKSMMTTAELTNLIHMRSRRMMPLVTDVEPIQNAVYYTIGSRRYMANRSLQVLEVADGKMFDSPHAKYQQGLLQGGKRDDAGTLIVEESTQCQ